MNEVYPIIQVSPSQLRAAPHQPPSRTELNGALIKLIRSLKSDGLQYPPLVTRSAEDGEVFHIIDGHRRHRAAIELGWPTMHVLVSSQGDAKRLFAAVSGAQKSLTAADWITVYLGGGELPPGQTATCIRQLDDKMGRPFLVEVQQSGLSPQVWNLSSRVLKHIGTDEISRPDILRWLVRHKNTRSVTAALQMDIQPGDLAAAIRENRGNL